jgi:hypothetical protein
MATMPTLWLHTPTELLVWAMVAHVIADWLLQTEWMAIHKTSLRHPAAYAHAGVYTLLMLPLFPWFLAALIGVTHLLVDTRVPVYWWLRVIKQMPPKDSQNVRLSESSLLGFRTTTAIVEAAVDQSFHLVTLAAASLAVFWFAG